MNRNVFLLSVTLSLPAVLGVRPVQAGWSAGGNPVCTTSDFQGVPVLAPDGMGGTFLVWDDGRNLAVWGQHLGLYGMQIWTSSGIQLGPSFFSEHPDIVSDGSGGFVVAWSTNGDIGVQRFDGNGTPLWNPAGVPVCTAANTQEWPKLLLTPNNEVIVAWRDGRDGVNKADVYANRVSATGSVLWGANGVLLGQGTGDVVSSEMDLAMVEDGSGGAYLVWNSSDIKDILGQRVSSAGLPAWNGRNGLTICSAAGVQKWPQVAGSGSAGAVFVWWDDRGAPFAQWVTSGGSPQYVTNGIQLFPSGNFGSVLMIAAGYLVSSNEKIQLFAPATGAPVWANAVDFSPPWGWPVKLASDGAGGAIGVYATTDQRMVARRVDANGNLLWPDDLDVCVGGAPSPPHLIRDTRGGIVAAWQDGRALNYDAYAQRIEPNGAIGILSNLNGVSFNVLFWDAPVVPRNYVGGDPNDVHVSSVLEGNTTTTYMNSLVWQLGPDPLSWLWRFLLDGEVLQDVSMPTTNPGAYGLIDQGPFMMRGGRHTVGHFMDPDNVLLENNETDNAYEGQWVWSPLSLSNGSGSLRTVPPDRSIFPNPSGDGFQMDRNGSYAWVISEAPRSSTDDYDLYVYDDYSGSTTGFSNLRKSSLYSWSATDFVVGHYSGTPTALFSQAVRYTKGNGNHFAFDQIDATGRNSGNTGNYSNQILRGNRLADVYEANLTAGTTYHFILNRMSAGSDLGLTIYPGTAGGIYSRLDGMLVSGAAVGQPVETLSDVIGDYTAAQSGWYPIVVYRQYGDDAANPVTYSLSWGPGVTGAPMVTETPALRFSGALPNPVVSSASFVFALPEPASVRLSLYDLNGRLVRRLADETREAGEQRVLWNGTRDDGSRLAPGIYFARMEAMGTVLSRRVVMLR